MKKYELTTDSITAFGVKLFRIKALISFGNVESGELGGYIEKEENLSHNGNAWVFDNAWVYGDAWVSGNAQVYGDAWVYGNAQVSCDADYATIKGFGSKYRNTTFFRTKENNVKVVCGCFYGTLEEFREKVKETHGESKLAKEYLMIADLIEYHFNR